MPGPNKMFERLGVIRSEISCIGITAGSNSSQARNNLEDQQCLAVCNSMGSREQSLALTLYYTQTNSDTTNHTKPLTTALSGLFSVFGQSEPARELLN